MDTVFMLFCPRLELVNNTKLLIHFGSHATKDCFKSQSYFCLMTRTQDGCHTYRECWLNTFSFWINVKHLRDGKHWHQCNTMWLSLKVCFLTLVNEFFFDLMTTITTTAESFKKKQSLVCLTHKTAKYCCWIWRPVRQGFASDVPNMYWLSFSIL